MYPEMQRVPRDPADIDAVLDRHGRPLALAGDDHGDAGGQGRLFREAVVHDDRRGPRGGRDRAAVRADLPDRRSAAQRGELRARHRAGPLRPARPGAYRSRPHRPLGRRRDEPRLAPRGAPAPQGRSGLGRLAGPLPLAAVQLDLHQGRLARSLRLPHQLHRRVGRAHVRPVAGRHRRAATPRPSNTTM